MRGRDPPHYPPKRAALVPCREPGGRGWAPGREPTEKTQGRGEGASRAVYSPIWGGRVPCVGPGDTPHSCSSGAAHVSANSPAEGLPHPSAPLPAQPFPTETHRDERDEHPPPLPPVRVRVGSPRPALGARSLNSLLVRARGRAQVQMSPVAEQPLTVPSGTSSGGLRDCADTGDKTRRRGGGGSRKTRKWRGFQ